MFMYGRRMNRIFLWQLVSVLSKVYAAGENSGESFN